jgi:hypothetical protein
MKRCVLIGLFLTATTFALPVFAGNESNLCVINLQKVRDAQSSNQGVSDQIKADVDSTLHRAESAYARNNDDGARECISLTTQAMQKMQSN